MQLSHTRPVASALFDHLNLVSCGGLVPVLALDKGKGSRRIATIRASPRLAFSGRERHVKGYH